VSSTKALPVGEQKRAMVKEMFDEIAPRYDLLNRIISLGLDLNWRKRSVKALGLPAGSVVLDLACGTGDFSRILARRRMVPIGSDLSAGMLNEAHSGIRPVLGDALCLPFRDRSLDGVVCGFALRNFTEISPVFCEIARVLRPGGRVALLEVATPSNRLVLAGHRIWFGQAVPAIGRLLSDPSAYRYLPESVEYLPTPEKIRVLMRDCGLRSVGHRTFGGGATQLFTATRRP
jgi:demethylmenaquinone methyltransferase / 2-methoxy-6-polyprenyl-1,4-benzoquinol methylase